MDCRFAVVLLALALVASTAFAQDANTIGPSTPACSLTDADCPVVCAECAAGYIGSGCSGGVDIELCECKQPQPCTVECNTYTDSAGCVVKECGDGYTAKECPAAQVECKTYVDSSGCTVKECSDGYIDKSCPTVECKKYADESGCTVVVCTDGREERYCPTAVECKTYVDAYGCTIEECSDGRRDRKCPIAEECKTYTDSAGCTVKVCTDGASAVICPNVECKKYVDSSGCTVVECTDGRATRDCPQVVCPTIEELAKREAECAASGMKTATVIDPAGCKTVKCFTDCVMGDAEIDARISRCKEARMDYAIYSDSMGCRQVECKSFAATLPQPTTGTVCRESYNPDTGFTEKTCEVACRPLSSEEKYKCAEAGGKPTIEYDARRCTYIRCIFPEAQVPATQPQQCPSGSDVERIAEKCREKGLTTTTSIDTIGCKYVKCVAAEEAPAVLCPAYRSEEITELREKCAAGGWNFAQEYDERGCSVYKCNTPTAACGAVPASVVVECEAKGGKYVEKKDERGCAVYSECIRRGEITGEVEISKIPDATKLLSLALKIEEVRVELDKLQRKASAIAAYYRSVGDAANADKVGRVAGLFGVAITKLDAIKIKIRDNAENMNEATLAGIKSDLRYIRQVLIKDILYIMLSSPEETIGGTGGEGVLDCGDDSECVKEAFRVCQKATARQAYGSDEMRMDITGLENGACVLTISLSYQGVAESMVCRDPEYAFPDTISQRMEQICTGTLVKRMSSFSTAAITSRKIAPIRPVDETRIPVPEQPREVAEVVVVDELPARPGCIEAGACPSPG